MSSTRSRVSWHCKFEKRRVLCKSAEDAAFFMMLVYFAVIKRMACDLICSSFFVYFPLSLWTK